MNITEFDNEFRRKIILSGDNYSTANRYGGHMKSLMRFYESKYNSPLQITSRDIEDYVLHLREKKYSPSTINQFIAAAKRFYKINGQPQKCKSLNYHENPIKTPNVLTVNEAVTMCNAGVYIKHRVVINLLYWAGLRRSELISLRICDISSDGKLNIVDSKYGKSRVVPMPKHVLGLLRDYYLKVRPNEYLLNGEGLRLQYSAKSIENVVKNTAILCGIKKKVHPHLLRSSRITHLMDAGAGMAFISKFAGHSKMQTTTDYYCAISIEGMRKDFERADQRIAKNE